MSRSRRVEKVRPSNYLNTVDIGDGRSLLYNGLSMCMDVVPRGVARRMADPAQREDLSYLTAAEEEHLAKRRHLTGLSVEDEREELRKLAEAAARGTTGPNGRYTGAGLISFILTYECNLSCSYCFQSGVNRTSRLAKMSEAFVDEFFHGYLDKLFPDVPKERLRFILFGGEPLLPGNRGTIERILRYAKEHGIVVSASTNGVLLPKMPGLAGLRAGEINNVQVTLDGGRMFHDKTRVTPAGGATFDKTIRAIRLLIEAEARANVRVHLHPDGLEAARELMEYLDGEKLLGHDNVEVYFAPVHSFHTKDMSPSEVDDFSRLFEYVALKQKKIPIQNFDYLERIMNAGTMGNLFQPRYCAVGTGTHYAVDPLGDIYECLEEAGRKEKRIGTLSGGRIDYFELREVYRKMYPANMPECLKCSIALFCAGGCISKTRTQGGLVFEQFCRQNKVFVAQTLRACFLLNQAEKAGKRE